MTYKYNRLMEEVNKLGKSESCKKNEKEPYWKVLTGTSNLIEKILNKKWKQHYNVGIYRVFTYPPDTEKKKLSELIR